MLEMFGQILPTAAAAVVEQATSAAVVEQATTAAVVEQATALTA